MLNPFPTQKKLKPVDNHLLFGSPSKILNNSPINYSNMVTGILSVNINAVGLRTL